MLVGSRVQTRHVVSLVLSGQPDLILVSSSCGGQVATHKLLLALHSPFLAGLLEGLGQGEGGLTLPLPLHTLRDLVALLKGQVKEGVQEVKEGTKDLGFHWEAVEEGDLNRDDIDEVVFRKSSKSKKFPEHEEDEEVLAKSIKDKLEDEEIKMKFSAHQLKKEKVRVKTFKHELDHEEVTVMTLTDQQMEVRAGQSLELCWGRPNALEGPKIKPEKQKKLVRRNYFDVPPTQKQDKSENIGQPTTVTNIKEKDITVMTNILTHKQNDDKIRVEMPPHQLETEESRVNQHLEDEATVMTLTDQQMDLREGDTLELLWEEHILPTALEEPNNKPTKRKTVKARNYFDVPPTVKQVQSENKSKTINKFKEMPVIQQLEYEKISVETAVHHLEKEEVKMTSLKQKPENEEVALKTLTDLQMDMGRGESSKLVLEELVLPTANKEPNMKPLKQKKIKSGNYFDVPPTLDQSQSASSVKCDKCEKKIKKSDLREHLKTYCGFVCPYSGCGVQKRNYNQFELHMMKHEQINS